MIRFHIFKMFLKPTVSFDGYDIGYAHHHEHLIYSKLGLFLTNVRDERMVSS